MANRKPPIAQKGIYSQKAINVRKRIYTLKDINTQTVHIVQKCGQGENITKDARVLKTKKSIMFIPQDMVEIKDMHIPINNHTQEQTKRVQIPQMYIPSTI